MTLYDFQTKAVDFHLDHHYSINASEMGLGKSRMALAAAQRSGAKQVLVIGPAALRRVWEHEGREVGQRFEYVSYSMLHKFKADTAERYRYWIADECFVEGTLVDTPKGRIAIEDLRPGDVVWSAAGSDVVVAVSRSIATATAKVNQTECTLNHPFLTQRGWVKAGDLCLGDELIGTGEAMQLLRDPVYAAEEKSRQVLRDILLGEMADPAARSIRENSYERGSEEDWRCEARKKESSVLRMASGEQLHVQARDPQEGIRYFEKYRSQAGYPGRQRSRPDQARSFDAEAAGSELALELRNYSQSTPIQDRSRQSRFKDSYRSRWAESRFHEGEASGPEEGGLAGRIRVESLEVQELRSRVTYNLQVKKHPSYSVNGTLVHNCHYLKNPTAKRTHAFYGLLKECRPEYLTMLTGTPLKNRIPDLWTMLAFCNQNPHGTSGQLLEGDLAKYYGFARYFCKAEQLKLRGRTIWKFHGVKEEKLPELKGLLKGKMIRFLVKEVLGELPPMTRQDVPLEIMMPAGEEDALAKTFGAYLSGRKSDIKAKTASAALKAAGTATYCRELMEGGSGPLLIFTDHLESAAILARSLGAGVLLATGETPVEERMKMVDRFQTGKIPALVATIGALSVGVTLTAARHVVFNDLSWVPADNLQAEKRIHRIGQKDACFAHYIEATATDRYIKKTLFEKMETIQKVIA